jgi:hypothetical protein
VISNSWDHLLSVVDEASGNFIVERYIANPLLIMVSLCQTARQAGTTI